jgi:pyruvate formate lyase activating enzyme
VVEIKGLEKFAPKDFPGFIASTVFLPGCSFRCPYCHNSGLVLKPKTYATIPMDFFLAYLDSRKGWLEGICISGGEPLAEPGLEELLLVIKERNLLVKLDTNGSFPEKLEGLIRAQLVDWIAMDVKAPLERYQEVTRSRVKTMDIERSAEFVKTSGLNYMFRTTVVPGLVGEDDILKISLWLSGSKTFQIQQFSPVNTMDEALRIVKPFSREEIHNMAQLARPHFDEIRVEGV